jgi:hypothetical protein
MKPFQYRIPQFVIVQIPQNHSRSSCIWTFGRQAIHQAGSHDVVEADTASAEEYVQYLSGFSVKLTALAL